MKNKLHEIADSIEIITRFAIEHADKRYQEDILAAAHEVEAFLATYEEESAARVEAWLATMSEDDEKRL